MVEIRSCFFEVVGWPSATAGVKSMAVRASYSGVFEVNCNRVEEEGSPMVIVISVVIEGDKLLWRKF